MCVCAAVVSMIWFPSPLYSRWWRWCNYAALKPSNERRKGGGGNQPGSTNPGFFHSGFCASAAANDIVTAGNGSVAKKIQSWILLRVQKRKGRGNYLAALIFQFRRMERGRGELRHCAKFRLRFFAQRPKEEKLSCKLQ